VNKGSWIFIGFIVVFHVVCTLNALSLENTKPKATKITLEEVLSVGTLEDDNLFQWVGIAVDTHDRIYVTDAMDYSLKKFGADGKFLKKAGRKGQGPGEFLAPRLLARSDSHLFVTDQSIPGIQVFDHDLNFVRRIPIKVPIGDIQALSNDRVAAVALSLDRPGRIHIYDLKGQVHKQIQYTQEKKSSMMDWVEIAFDREDNLFVLYNFQDRIEKFDADGKRVWSRPLLNIKEIKTKKIGPWEVPEKILFKDVVFDSYGRLYILGGGFSKNQGRDVYLLNADGERLATFSLPESSHCIYIDTKDCLYSRANDGITLKKYKMRWPKI
jgi:hypothetical protein